jgi:hypothetical protein
MRHMLARLIGRYAVLVRLAPTGPGAPVTPATAVDIIWAGATAAECLDHVRARPAADAHGLDIVLILRAATGSEALERTRALCGRAVHAPLLDGWSLRHTDAITIADLMP